MDESPPESGQYPPAGHGAHSVLREPNAYEPAGQGWQLSPCRDASAEMASPVPLLYVPEKQGMQLPSTSPATPSIRKVPLGHGVAAPEPGGQKCPAVQPAQSACAWRSVPAPKVPPWHS